ncbi:HU family DNA-binding protein [Lentibacter sp. XHP0401]|jgi:nucleoid DNA-binding protein|uniref:HU family DNA-binding protein n=1 Tax=Lentibacter sp. XHP0401 TaxID=2984334 RepID=UPI0021E8F31B|nr:HU family DNA-binding protein [Lentibacter sp. XHP0401]MCV2891894.1 HU family DNA-binding protein [Lentibacter sp. XHP0401]
MKQSSTEDKATKAAKPAKATTVKKAAPKKTAAKAVKAPKAVKKPALAGTGPTLATVAPTAAPEAKAAAPKVTPMVVTSAEPTLAPAEMRKEQLLDEVAKRSGAKRKDVKPIAEAMLEVLGEALGEARELNLKPLGKIKVARTKLVANGRVIQLRLRQSDMVIKELEDKAEAAE